jgi:ABC-type Mn2+/Zn2+ transport system permease subunit
MNALLLDPIHRHALLTAAALGVACSILSVVVVLRRWAFIGEGIGHAGFGGAGTAWLAALLVPAWFDRPWMPYVAVVIFCVLTAVAIGYVARGQRVNADAAIGIFLVASLAWGFAASSVYMQFRHAAPAGFDTLLFGQMTALGSGYSISAAAICLAVLLTCILLWKEILAYSFDPLMAETSGVRAGFVHYLLMVMLAVVIVIGVRVAGSVLVTALLVLPGATALTLARRMSGVIAISIAVALTGAVGGLFVSAAWSYIPAGPVIVLVMFLEFLGAYVVARALARA